MANIPLGSADDSSESVSIQPETDSSASPPKGFTPPDMPMQESEKPTNPTQTIVLIALSMITLVAALVFVKRSKSHQ